MPDPNANAVENTGSGVPLPANVGRHPHDRAGPLDDLPARGTGQVSVTRAPCESGHCMATYRS
jgi:hypothetical protein